MPKNIKKIIVNKRTNCYYCAKVQDIGSTVYYNEGIKKFACANCYQKMLNNK